MSPFLEPARLAPELIPLGGWLAVSGLTLVVVVVVVVVAVVVAVGLYPASVIRFLDAGSAGFWRSAP